VIKAYLHHLGLEVDFDEKEKLVNETEGVSISDAEGMLYDSVDREEPVSELPDSPLLDVPSNFPVKPLSWWDSPIIMHQCETFITGNPEISFYDYLKKEYLITDLVKGLSICNKLKVIEENFITYNACSSFDVISDFDDLDYLSGKIREFKLNHYDLLLCIDVLSHIRNLDMFLSNAKDILKDDGFIIALEYIGPAHFQWAERDIGIADMLYKAFNGQYDLPATSVQQSAKISDYTNEKGVEAAVSSETVIPMLQKRFDIVAVRYFGGPLYNLLLNKILQRLDQENGKDAMLMKTIMQCEQVLIKNGILENQYAMIIGKKRKSYGG